MKATIEASPTVRHRFIMSGYEILPTDCCSPGSCCTVHYFRQFYHGSTPGRRSDDAGICSTGVNMSLRLIVLSPIMLSGGRV